MDDLKQTVEGLWNKREQLKPGDDGHEAVAEVLSLLDKGELRVAEKKPEGWQVNAWVKKAVVLYLILHECRLMRDAGTPPSYDRVPLKFQNWSEADFKKAGFRAIPGSLVRFGAYIGPGAILMPSYVNMGAYVGAGTMVDTWATIGSCAQVGKNCHISGGTGLGGVLEPVQAAPVIIEDNCFIGARSEVAEGVIIKEGSVLSMGVYLSQSTPIINRATGDVSYGRVPAYSVVIPGNLPGKDGGPGTYAAVIVKQVDEKTRAKTSINDLLRP